MQLRPYQQRVVDSMQNNRIGQLIVPTGGGKTFCMIEDAKSVFSSQESKTIVVVAPRILLAEQLSSEFLEFVTNADVMHVHTGETHHYRTTKPQCIWGWDYVTDHHKLIFTTYHSLDRIQSSGIHVDTIYFDEAHNSVKRHFFPATEYFSQEANRCFFFTATPKHSAVYNKPGMNDVDVYGRVLAQVKASELIESGAIISPRVVVNQLPMIFNGDIAGRDCANLLNTLDTTENMDRVLITASKTKHIAELFSESDFYDQVRNRGYNVMWITSKHGANINGQKVNREVFFNTLNEWGRDVNQKFIVLHHSILAEGINVSGLTACILMRNMNYIEMAQTIGRVIRLDPRDREAIQSGLVSPGDVFNYFKQFGTVCVPVYSKVGISTAQSLQSVVDTIFEKGQPAISTIQK